MTKRYLIAAAAHNLGRILRKLFGVGKPRALQGAAGFAAIAYFITPVVMHWLDRVAWRSRATRFAITQLGARYPPPLVTG